MKTRKTRKDVSTAALITAIGCLLLGSGCTHTRVVNLRYTPLIQTQRLADRGAPQKITVGSFEDARPDAKLAQHRVNPINAHTYRYETKDDVPALARSACVDALLKSGFEVPLPNQQEGEPLFTLTGKVRTFQADTKIGWSKITLTADVAIDLTLKPRSGEPVSFQVQGQNVQEQKEFMNIESAVPDALDRALQECAKKFLEREEFLKLVKK